MPSVDIPSGLITDLRSLGLNPTDVVLYINSGCNLRCKHCYVGTALLNQAVHFSAKSISGFVKDLPALDRVTLLGGEPFFHPNLLEIIDLFGRTPCKERRLTTNLTVFDSDAMSLLKSAHFRVCVSLDGHTAALHDELRGVGAFGKTLENLRRIVNDDFDVEVTHTLTKQNLSFFWEFVSLCKSIGLKRLNLHRVSLRGNALSNRHLDIPATEWRKLIDTFENRANTAEGCLQVRYEVGFVTRPEYDALVTHGQYEHHSRASFYSQSGGSRVVIFPNQRIYISSEAFGTNSHIGDFVDGRFRFNENPENELIASDTPEFNTSAINCEIVGDENFPIPLSVSYRRNAVI